MALTIVDASALFAAYDRRQPEHQQVVHQLRNQRGPWLVSPLNLAEFDYLAVTRLGPLNAAAAARDISTQMTVAPFDNEDLAKSAAVAARCADLAIGLADASIIVLAARHKTLRVLTLDRRHFAVVKPLWGGDHFILLPDAE